MAIISMPGPEGHAMGGSGGLTGREMIYFAPDVTDVSTAKRAHAFEDRGFRVTVFGFRRDRYNCDYVPPWPYVPLGRTEDGRYRQRLIALAGALPKLIAHRRFARRAAILYARNIDQLLLALLMRISFCRRAVVAYEVLDIPAVLVGRGLRSRALRMIERLCLRHIHVLVLSSPAFFHQYYSSYQRYRKEWFLLENKVHRSSLSVSPSTRNGASTVANKASYRWTVGYFGLIRGQSTFDLLSRVAARLSDTVLFKFCGVLTTIDHGRFDAVLRQNANMIYDGTYVNPRDLREIYGGVDFAWAIDLENVDHNSRWLRPCRFYEAGLHGVPSLAIRGFEVGSLIDELDVGWTFSEPLEDTIVRFFERLTATEYAAKRERLLSLPLSSFVCGDDIAALSHRLGEIAANA